MEVVHGFAFRATGIVWSLERVFIVTAQWDSTAKLRSSVLDVTNTIETCNYPPQMMMWNFKYCRKKKQKTKVPQSLRRVGSLM